MQNFNFNLNKQLNQLQQQQLFQAQQQQQLHHHQQQQQQQYSGLADTSSALDYSLNRASLLAFNQANTPLNLSQHLHNQQYQEYQQKKLNYKAKLKSDLDDSLSTSAAVAANKNSNEDKDIEDDDYNDDNYEMNPNLDSSFSNYSYSTEQSSDLLAKNSIKKPKSSNNLQLQQQQQQQQIKLMNNVPIKQELQEVNDFASKKRRESYTDSHRNTINNDDDDDNYSEMNDDDEELATQMNDSKEKRPKSELNCVVCDSPANGYNFDAVTCESCKAFFRRNAFRPINLFRCSNNDSCVITVATRKKCKKCRIAKCFRLGMRRDWIMTEVEREEKRKKIEENRRRKQSSGGGAGSSSADLDALNQFGGPMSNMSSNQYDDYTNQGNDSTTASSLPVRRRRRRRRNSWFDINNKKQPQQQTVNQSSNISNTNNKQINDLNHDTNTTTNNNNNTKQSATNVTVNNEKQNSPLSSSLSSSSSSSSSSLTNRNRLVSDSTNLSLNHEINENLTQQTTSTPFNLHANSGLLPLNLMTKSTLEQVALQSKLTSQINQYILENNSKPNSNSNTISSSFVLSPTVQQQLQLTFEQQQRLLKTNLEFNTQLSNPSTTNSTNTSNTSSSSGSNTSETLIKHQQYAAAAAAAAAMAATSVSHLHQQQQQQHHPQFNSTFNLTKNSTCSNLHVQLGAEDDNSASESAAVASLLDDKKFDPRRRRKLKEASLEDAHLLSKLPVNQQQHQQEQQDLMSNFDGDNKLLVTSSSIHVPPVVAPLPPPPQLAVNTLLPSLKHLSKSNISHLNEIKLQNNNKNESSYITFSSIDHQTHQQQQFNPIQHFNNLHQHDQQQIELVRSPRVLSPVSSTSSSSSSSSLSSCDQYQYSQTNSVAPAAPTAENICIKMTEIQRKQVEAIQQAYKQAIQLVKAQGLPKNSQDINTTINITELAVRRIIFYFKLISDFRELKHDLMVVLLKFNMMSLLQIHGINSYNKEENTFKEPDTDDTPFSAQSIESVYGTSVYDLSISITRNLFDLCAGEMTHIKILMLIVLFDPYNDKLSETEKATVAKLQNKYVTLLHAYLCEIMGSPRAEHTFKAILIEISKINDLGKWFEKTVAEKSSCDFVRPLMKEVFGIATPANSAASTPIASSQPSSIGSSCSAKSMKLNDPMECTNNDSNYETPTTCSTSLSDSSFYNTNLNTKYVSSSPNNNNK